MVADTLETKIVPLKPFNAYKWMFPIVLLIFSFVAGKIIQNKIRLPIVQSTCRMVAKVVLVNIENMSWVRTWLERHTWLHIVELMNLSAGKGKISVRLILESFHHSKSSAKVLQLAVCREPHKSKGIHYHMGINSDRN